MSGAFSGYWFVWLAIGLLQGVLLGYEFSQSFDLTVRPGGTAHLLRRLLLGR